MSHWPDSFFYNDALVATYVQYPDHTNVTQLCMCYLFFHPKNSIKSSNASLTMRKKIKISDGSLVLWKLVMVATYIITRTHGLHFTESRSGNRTSKTNYPKSTTRSNKPTTTYELYSHFTVPMYILCKICIYLVSKWTYRYKQIKHLSAISIWNTNYNIRKSSTGASKMTTYIMCGGLIARTIV